MNFSASAYVSVSALVASLEFAVPGGRSVMDNEVVSNREAVTEYLEGAASNSEYTAEKLQEQMANLDLMAMSLTPSAEPIGIAQSMTAA